MMLTLSCEYALDLLAALKDAGGDQAPVSLAALAARCGVPVPHGRRLMEALREAGVVAGVRGRHGGYGLLRPLWQITLRQVWQASQAAGLPLAFRPDEKLSRLAREVDAALRQSLEAVMNMTLEAFLEASQARPEKIGAPAEVFA